MFESEIMSDSCSNVTEMSRDSLEEVTTQSEAGSVLVEPTEIASKRDEVKVSVPFYDGEVLLTVNQLPLNKLSGIKIKKYDTHNVYMNDANKFSARNECVQYANGTKKVCKMKLQMCKKKTLQLSNHRHKSYLEQYRVSKGINIADKLKQPSSVRPNIGDLECGSISSFGTLYCEDKCEGECFNDVFYNSILNKSEPELVLKLHPSEEGNDSEAAVSFGKLCSISETGEVSRKKNAKITVRFSNVAPLESLGPDIQRIRTQVELVKKQQDYAEAVRLKHKIKFSERKFMKDVSNSERTEEPPACSTSKSKNLNECVKSINNMQSNVSQKEFSKIKIEMQQNFVKQPLKYDIHHKGESKGNFTVERVRKKLAVIIPKTESANSIKPILKPRSTKSISKSMLKSKSKLTIARDSVGSEDTEDQLKFKIREIDESLHILEEQHKEYVNLVKGIKKTHF